MILYIVLVALHIVLSLALILIVLLQTGKGSDLASAFGGGGANAVFGGAGPTSFLNRMTTAVAVLFMVTSISLAYIGGGGGSSIMPEQAGGEEVVMEDEGAAGETEESAERAAEAGQEPAVDAGQESAAEPAPGPVEAGDASSGSGETSAVTESNSAPVTE